MKKITVSIGIPIYNEENTIGVLIRSLLLQRGNFILEKIYVICDGSNSETVKETIKVSKQDKRVKAIIFSENRGKAARLNEIFKLNKSDYVVIFDGDVLIKDNYLVNKLVANFGNPQVGLVSSNNQPLEVDRLVGKVSKAAEDLWYETRKNVNQGDNYYNNSGCGVALEKKFSKSFKLPNGLISDQTYIYYQAKKLKRSFVFVKDAVVYYMPPQTMADVVKQYRRSLHEDEKLKKFYSIIAVKITAVDKLTGLLRSLIKNPIDTMLAVCGLFALRHLPLNADPLTKKGTWLRIDSSKQKIR